MYASAAEALTALLEGKVDGPGCTITSKLHEIAFLQNGIKYFAVEVTSETGAQYGIFGYDQEAEELYKVALQERAPRVKVPLIIPMS